MRSNVQALSSSDKRSDQQRQEQLLEYVGKEIDRNLDSSKWSGTTLWGLVTALMGALAFLFNEITNSVVKINLLDSFLLYLFILTNAIFITYSLKLFLSVFKKYTSGIPIVSRIQLNLIYSYSILLINVSYLVVITNLLFLIAYSQQFNNDGLIIASILWCVIKGQSLGWGLRHKLNEVKGFGENSHYFTFLIQPKRKIRIIGIFPFIIFELVNLILLVLFFEFNHELITVLDPTSLGKLLPSLVSFIMLVIIIYLLLKRKVDRQLVVQLQELEYQIIEREYTSEEILDKLKETYKGYTITEWLEARYKGVWSQSEAYFIRVNNILNQAKDISEDPESDIEKRGLLFASLLIHKQFDENELLNYVLETEFHFKNLEESSNLQLLDPVWISLTYDFIESLEKHVSEKANLSTELLNRLQKFYPSHEEHANHPLNN